MENWFRYKGIKSEFYSNFRELFGAIVVISLQPGLEVLQPEAFDSSAIETTTALSHSQILFWQG